MAEMAEAVKLATGTANGGAVTVITFEAVLPAPPAVLAVSVTV